MDRKLEEAFQELQLDTEDVVLETASMLKKRYNSTMAKVLDAIALWWLHNDIKDLTDAQSNMDSLMTELDGIMDPASEEYIEVMTEHFALVFAFNLQYSQRILDLEETSDEEALLLFTVLGLASMPWTDDGLTYRERMTHRNTQLKNNIRQIITRGAAMGLGTRKLLSDVKHEMSKQKYRGTSVLVDESNHFANEAVKYGAEKDFDGYEVSEVLDMKTCDTCLSMHGKRFRWDQYDVGITAPQFHISCRGRIIPVGKSTPNT